MRYAMVENGVVTNVILATPEFAAEVGAIACAEDVGIGHLFDGTDFTVAPPVVVVPQAVTMRQARLALLGAGLLSQVTTAIDALPEPAKSAALIEWEYSNEVLRHNGFVSQLAVGLNLTEAQLDSLFITAATL
jgi:hypothetical protein